MPKLNNRFDLLALEQDDDEGAPRDSFIEIVTNSATEATLKLQGNDNDQEGTMSLTRKLSKGRTLRNENPFDLQPRTRMPGWVGGRSKTVSNERIKNDFLCQECQSIFQNYRKLDEYGNSDGFVLHSTYDSFKIALAGDCYICHQILRSIKEKLDVHDFETELQSNFQYLTCEVAQEELDQYLFFTYKDVKSDRKGYPSILELKLQSIPDIEPLVHTAHITNWVRSKRNLGLVRYWLRTCQTHRQCQHIRTIANRQLPTRLIEIANVGGMDTFRLVEGAAIPSLTPYVTLSHCWGSEPVYSLLHSNLKDLRGKIQISKLPQCFRDALFMTSHLGFNYLWIDSLCIIQDSHEDWIKEAPAMCEVYKNASCNLAATGFSDGRAGLFPTRDARFMLPRKVFVDWDGMRQHGAVPLRGQYYILDDRLWLKSVSDAPLNRRAWVVQERVLSPCIIHFGKEQLFWECSELQASEVFPNGFDHQIMTGEQLNIGHLQSARVFYAEDEQSTTRERLYAFWKAVMIAYSKGQLTKSQDKLPALSGIAREMWLSLKERYIAGLWEGDLLHSLLWSVSQTEDSTNPSSEYRAPTWSWTSLDAEIDYGHATKYKDSPIRQEDVPKEVLHSKILTADPTGAWGPGQTSLVIEWSLRIRGPLRKAVARKPMRSIHNFDLEVNSRNICIQLKPDLLPGTGSPIETTSATSKSHNVDSPFFRTRQRSSIRYDLRSIFLLPIRSDWEDYWNFETEIYGLALYPTGRRRGEFQRVGLFVVGEKSDQETILKHEEVLEEQYYEEIDEGEYVIKIV